MAAEEDKIRQIFESSMDRIEQFINSRRFLESGLELLKVKEEHLKSLFTEFTNQHSQIVRFRSQEVFEKHNAHYAEVEERYQDMLVEFRKQMAKKEREKESMQMSDNDTGKEEGEVAEADSSSECTQASTKVQSCVVVVPNKPNSERTVRIHERGTHRHKFKQERFKVQSRMRNTVGPRHNGAQQLVCNFCREEHKMFECHHFLKLSIARRRIQVKEKHLCKNCFMFVKKGGGHRCPSKPCKRCGAFHNSLLCAARLIDRRSLN